MKQLLFLCLCFCALTQIFAQNKTYQPFKLDLATGFLIPTGNTFMDSRLVFSVEPKYNVTDQFSLGLRIEVAPSTNFAGTSDSLCIKNIFSYVFTGEYLFNNTKNLRPFFGAGAGIFNQTLRGTGYPETTTKTGKPGIVTRAGVERKHFRFAVEYNLTFFEQEKKMNYIGLKFGGFLWGNHKRK